MEEVDSYGKRSRRSEKPKEKKIPILRNIFTMTCYKIELKEPFPLNGILFK